MGLRFRKTIKLFPGLKLNISKSGVSASIGGRGATINVSNRGTKATVGLPGTGISYTESLSKPAHSSAPRIPVQHPESMAQLENQPRSGMGFGALLLWAVLGLFVFLVFYGIMNP